MDEDEDLLEVEYDEPESGLKADPTKSSEAELVEPYEGEESERQQVGRRAEKRIKALIAQRKQLEELLAKEQQEKQKLTRTLQDMGQVSQSQEENNFLQHKTRIQEAEKRLEAEWRRAKAEEDDAALLEITKAFSRVGAEKLALDAWEQSRASRPKAATPPPTPQPRAQGREEPDSPPRPDGMTIRWAQQNKWFGRDQEMTETAMEIHNELVSEGFIPNAPPESDGQFNEYYQELNKRLKGEFPQKFEKARPRTSGTSSVAPNRGVSKGKVKLSASEVERARRLGVDLKDYAREKQKLALSRG